MSGRSDLDAKLEGASDWVRDEFGFIAGLADDLGCEVRPEGGPGLAFRVGGRLVARAHPKTRYIGVGVPEWMRSDVQALTGALRAQQGFAWFNYMPEIADRETVELLVAVSRDAVLSPTRASPQPIVDPDQLQRSKRQRSERDDEADLSLVLAILRAFRAHADATGFAGVIKPIREAIFFQWEGPRLPPGGKYSLYLPHSPAAREQRASGRHDALVYEHVSPIAHVIRGLLEHLPADTTALRAELDANAERVIITKAEDMLLTAAGMRDSAPEANDPWSRYQSIGLSEEHFAPISTSAGSQP